MQFVSLELAKLHIRKTYFDLSNNPLSDNTEDELINLYIDSASAWIQDYLGLSYATREEIPAPIRVACLLLVGESYQRRESAVVGTYTDTYTVTNLLQPYRKVSVY